MILENLELNIVPAELVIVIVFAICLGAFLKSTKKIADEAIPMIILAATVLCTVFYNGAFTVENVMLGVICAAIAVFSKNVQKQIQKYQERE